MHIFNFEENVKNNVLDARGGRSVNLCLVGLLDDIGWRGEKSYKLSLHRQVAQTRRPRHISLKMLNLIACNKALSDKGISFPFNFVGHTAIIIIVKKGINDACSIFNGCFYLFLSVSSVLYVLYVGAHSCPKTFYRNFYPNLIPL